MLNANIYEYAMTASSGGSHILQASTKKLFTNRPLVLSLHETVFYIPRNTKSHRSHDYYAMAHAAILPQPHRVPFTLGFDQTNCSTRLTGNRDETSSIIAPDHKLLIFSIPPPPAPPTKWNGPEILVISLSCRSSRTRAVKKKKKDAIALQVATCDREKGIFGRDGFLAPSSVFFTNQRLDDTNLVLSL